MKDELDGQIMKKIVGLRAKTYSYLKDQEPQKMCHIKKTNFQDYKTYLEVAQIENKINHLEKRWNWNSLKEDQKEFIKNNKLILKIQERFRSEKHNVFTEEIKKITLSLNGCKRMESIISIDIYAYGMKT